MDPITAAVRDMYEQFPYGREDRVLNQGIYARLALSYVQRSRETAGRLHVLDAGCGGGVLTITNAVLQPDVDFLGIDLNRTALKIASQKAEERKLNNVKFEECDLMTLEGLDVPTGGFDVIYSSGVIHHTSDPVTALGNLRKILAPHGVIALMVYARFGRAPLLRLIHGTDLLVSRDLPISERIAPARALAEFARKNVLAGTPWENTADTDDIEFVDRALNINETSYDIASLWDLLEKSRTRFVRWLEPEDWSVQKVFLPGELLDRAVKLSELDRYKLIEHVCWRRSFDLFISRDDNLPREPFRLDDILPSVFAVNPEAAFILETRNLQGLQCTESFSYKLRSRAPVKLAWGPTAKALMMLRNQNKPFSGDSCSLALQKEGLTKIESHAVIADLVGREILYRPRVNEL
jgi:2-polyprenyl-3-methyl-5-hydroxy-6-metoxy-1,4-benzoquinol methylase